MKTKSLRTLLYLAENNCNFGISKIIGIPRSTMWSHIDELEKDLGVQLISRQKQNSHFTKEGLVFIPFAKQILNDLQNGINAINDEEIDTNRGKIIIATTKAVTNSWITDSICKFYNEHPDLQVAIISDDKYTKNIEHTADILLRPLINVPDDFEARWGISYTNGLYASPDYLKQNGNPKTPNDLKKHSIIGYGDEEFHGFEEVNWHIKGKNYGLPKLQPTLTINSTSAIYSAAAKGIGICSTTNLSDSVYSNNLIRVLPDIVGPCVKLYCCLRKDLNKTTHNNLMVFEKFFVNYLMKIGIKIDYE